MCCGDCWGQACAFRWLALVGDCPTAVKVLTSTEVTMCIFHLTWTWSGSRRHPCLEQTLGSEPAFLWKQIRGERERQQGRLACAGLRGFISALPQTCVSPSGTDTPLPAACGQHWHQELPEDARHQKREASSLTCGSGTFSHHFQQNKPALQARLS